MSAETTPHSTHKTKDEKKIDAGAAAKTDQWWQSDRAKKSLAGVVIVAFVGAIIWWFFIHPFVTTDDARVAATFVRTAPESGGGRIIAIKVSEGDRVKKGDVLVELDHRNAEAQLARAKARADLAQDDLKRMSQLVAQHAMPAKDFDAGKATGITTQAELQLAQVAFENTTIKSSVDGIVVLKSAEVGNVVEPGQTLITICDIDHAWVEANIEETSVGAVKVGQPVTITVDEGGGLNGKVSEIRQSVASKFALIPSDSGAGNFTKVVQRVPIKIALDGASERTLRAGQSVEIKIRVH